jgi:sulfide:quinone oxidoreductase
MPGQHESRPPRVVVAGAGVAGLETVVALRGLVGHRVAPTLVAPEDEFIVRALQVYEPFGVGHPQRYPLADLATELDVELVRDGVARVDHAEHVAHLQSGGLLSYDALVLALGAFAYPAYEHGACFQHSHDPTALDEVIADLRAGLAERVAIVVPPGCAWTLPAYELALMTAALVKPRELSLVTAEDQPLGAFGEPAAVLVRAELEAAGIGLLTGVQASVPHPTVVQASPSTRLQCDRIVHLPLLSGPNCRGVPCDANGFVLVDDGFRVRGAVDAFAVGDATAGAYKQGGLAAQQADVVAEQIAWRAGAMHRPRPYRPVLRGLMRTVSGPRYLRAEPPGGAVSAVVSDEPLWWPASKVAARWLTAWLAARDVAKGPLPEPRRLPTDGLSWSAGA